MIPERNPARQSAGVPAAAAVGPAPRCPLAALHGSKRAIGTVCGFCGDGITPQLMEHLHGRALEDDARRGSR